MKKLLLILIALPMIGFGQNVNIPDANFKAGLVGNTSINTNGDTEIQVSEATVFNGAINCGLMQTGIISDLTGIEAFTSLTELSCGEGNPLVNIDVSQNIALTSLICWVNQLTSLDVSQNTALTYLRCDDNQLTSLDLSQNTYLTDLYCWENQLTSLDLSSNTNLNLVVCLDNQISSFNFNSVLSVLNISNNLLTNLDLSQNIGLTVLNCTNNQLTSLDLRNGNNSILNAFLCAGNSNLSCINVDNSQYSLMNWTGASFLFDPQHYFSNNCPPSAIDEHTTNKELLKVTDLLGRETKGTNQALFYIYDDGTVEKRIVIE